MQSKNLSKKRNGFIDISIKNTDTSNKTNTVTFPFALTTKDYNVLITPQDSGTSTNYRVSADNLQYTSVTVVKTVAAINTWVRIAGY